MGGIVANQINAITWLTLNTEADYRKGFYNANNQVDFNNSEQNKSFSGAVLNYQDRSNLINFITDGYLPINSINQAGFSNEQKLTVLGQNLDIANMGLQTIGQLNNLNPSAIKLQKATVDKVNNLLKQYKDLGGDTKKYDTMKDCLTPSSNQ